MSASRCGNRETSVLCGGDMQPVELSLIAKSWCCITYRWCSLYVADWEQGCRDMSHKET